MITAVFRPKEFKQCFNNCYLPHLKTFVEKKLKLGGKKDFLLSMSNVSDRDLLFTYPYAYDKGHRIMVRMR